MGGVTHGPVQPLDYSAHAAACMGMRGRSTQHRQCLLLQQPGNTATCKRCSAASPATGGDAGERAS